MWAKPLRAGAGQITDRRPLTLGDGVPASIKVKLRALYCAVKPSATKLSPKVCTAGLWTSPVRTTVKEKFRRWG